VKSINWLIGTPCTSNAGGLLGIGWVGA